MYVRYTYFAHTPLKHMAQPTAHNVAAHQTMWLQARILTVRALHGCRTRFAEDLYPIHGAYRLG